MGFPTRPFGFSVYDTAQPENDGAFILLNNLQRRREEPNI
jgi:hypothetical protein